MLQGWIADDLSAKMEHLAAGSRFRLLDYFCDCVGVGNGHLHDTRARDFHFSCKYLADSRYLLGGSKFWLSAPGR